MLDSPTASRLWRGLTPGPYSVGFSTGYELDGSRRSPSSLHPPHRKTPRPILVSLWYPTARTDSPTMTYGEYLDLRSDDPLLSEFSRRLTATIDECVCQEALGTSIDDARSDGRFGRLTAMPTMAVRSATPADGSFPLVVYHPGLGGSYADNSILFEFLASHGYVVVSSAYQPRDGIFLEIDGNVESSVSDIEFLIEEMRSRSFVDWSRVAVMGHSFGASASLELFARNDVADALVSLDSTLDYAVWLPYFEERRKRLVDARRSMTAPMLVVARPEATFTLCDSLVYSDRHYLRLDGLEHNDFTSHGAIAASLLLDSSADTHAAEGVINGYQLLCSFVLKFLDRTLREGKTHGALETVLDAPRYEHRAATVPVPTALWMEETIGKLGVVEAIRSARRFVADEPRFLGESYLRRRGLARMNEGALDDAIALFRFWIELYPESTEGHEHLGAALMKHERPVEAIDILNRALSIIDADSRLDERGKADAGEYVERMLTRLKDAR